MGKRKQRDADVTNTRYAALIKAMRVECPHVLAMRRVMKAAVMEVESKNPETAMKMSAECANMQSFPDDLIKFIDVELKPKSSDYGSDNTESCEVILPI